MFILIVLGVIAYVCFVIWFLKSISGSPFMDDKGNIIDKERDNIISVQDTKYH